jgi:parallel beta-helix repeat protein
MWLEYSSGNRVSGNNATNGGDGIKLMYSSGNTLRNNTMAGNTANFGIDGSSLSDFSNDVDLSNTVNGKPVYYWITAKDETVPPEAGCVILVNCTRITLQDLNITNNDPAIQLAYTTNTTITHNNVTNSSDGISLEYSSGNDVSDNNAINNSQTGISVGGGFNNTVSENEAKMNMRGISVGSPNSSVFGNNVADNSEGISVGGPNVTVFGNNVVNNNQSGIMVRYSLQNEVFGNNVSSSDFGIFLVSCSGGNISGNDLTGNVDALGVDQSSNNIISGNNVTANSDGIVLGYSTNNIIFGNNVSWNSVDGVNIEYSSNGNRFYHNNFIGNHLQAEFIQVGNTTNSWDDGYPSGGNYWSNYTGADSHSGSHQNETGSDGIGDVPYEVGVNNMDRYPLMGPFSTFDAGVWNGTALSVDFTSNSTITHFQIDVDQRTVSFNVTASESTIGFCRATIPNIIVNNLWRNNYTVLVDGKSWPFTSWNDTTSTYIYLNYDGTENQVVIVPELSSTLIFSLIAVLFTPAIAYAKTKAMRKTKYRHFRLEK